MKSVLTDGRFWTGVVVGYLLVVFMPVLSFRAKAGKAQAAGGFGG